MIKFVAAHPGPSFSVQDVHTGWVEALRSFGNPVAEYNLDERMALYGNAMLMDKDENVKKAFSNEQAMQLAVNGLFSTLYRLKPDVLFVTYATFYPDDLFKLARSYGTRVVLMHTESPYEDEDRQIKLAALADINLINDPTNIEKFKEQAPTYYMPHSYRPELHCPGPSDKDMECDVSFVGTGYPSRIRFLEEMDFNGLDFLLAGSWQLLKKNSPLHKYLATEEDRCLDNEQTVDVYRSSRLGLNIYRKELDLENECPVQGWSCGPREIEMAATGLFFLREPRGESDELFPMLPSFSSPEEASHLVRWWLDHDDIREEMATLARSRVKDRTFKNRAAELMQLLEK